MLYASTVDLPQSHSLSLFCPSLFPSPSFFTHISSLYCPSSITFLTLLLSTSQSDLSQSDCTNHTIACSHQVGQFILQEGWRLLLGGVNGDGGETSAFVGFLCEEAWFNPTTAEELRNTTECKHT